MVNDILLYYKKPHLNICILIIIILFMLTLIILSYKIKTFDYYKVVGIIECEDKCTIKFSLPYNKIDILSKSPKILYQNKEYNIEDISYSEPYLNNDIPVEDIELISNIKKDDNLIEFSIIYNKQRIINKIKNLIERT